MMMTLVNNRPNEHHVRTFEGSRTVESYNVNILVGLWVQIQAIHLRALLFPQGLWRGTGGELRRDGAHFSVKRAAVFYRMSFWKGVISSSMPSWTLSPRAYSSSSLFFLKVITEPWISSHVWSHHRRLGRCFCLPCFEFFMLTCDISLVFLTITFIFLVHSEPHDGSCNTGRHAY